MARIIKKLITEVNTQFYPFDKSRSILLDQTEFCGDPSRKEKEIRLNTTCGNIRGILDQNVNGYKPVFGEEYSQYKRNSEEDKLVANCVSAGDDYTISTGLFIGSINLTPTLSLEINTGYSNTQLWRMIKYRCGLFVNENQAPNAFKSKNIYSLIVPLVFLFGLKKAMGTALPRKYEYLRDRGYNIKGNIDINAFVTRDIIAFDKKVSYIYPERVDVQNMIDVLSAAVRKCRKYGDDIFPDIKQMDDTLRNMASSKRPSRMVIKNVTKEKCLRNSIYSCYKEPLEYARMLLENEDLESMQKQGERNAPSYIFDAALLWETYLYNIMNEHLGSEWEINRQFEFPVYENSFFGTINKPDFVLINKTDGRIYVLDAKFKKMRYSENYRDVDNKDLQQLHSYAYYFSLEYDRDFKGIGLIYPSTTERKNRSQCEFPMFGLNLKRTAPRFGIFSVQDVNEKKGEDENTLRDHERIFIDELRQFLK